MASPQTAWLLWATAGALGVLVVLLCMHSWAGDSQQQQSLDVREAVNNRTQSYFNTIYTQKTWGEYAGGSGLVSPDETPPLCTLYDPTQVSLHVGCLRLRGCGRHVVGCCMSEACWWCVRLSDTIVNFKVGRASGLTTTIWKLQRTVDMVSVPPILVRNGALRLLIPSQRRTMCHTGFF